MSKAYTIAVQSAPGYEEVFVEVEFPQGVAFLVSQERGEDLYDVLVATEDAGSWATYFEARNEPARQLKLHDVIEALNEARETLAAMSKTQPVIGDRLPSGEAD